MPLPDKVQRLLPPAAEAHFYQLVLMDTDTLQAWSEHSALAQAQLGVPAAAVQNDPHVRSDDDGTVR